jgi:hypothetical protein
MKRQNEMKKLQGRRQEEQALKAGMQKLAGT